MTHRMVRGSDFNFPALISDTRPKTMNKHRFRPTALSTLEERITPTSGLASHVTPSGSGTFASLASLNGKVVVNQPSMPGAAQTATLSGLNKLPLVGTVHTTGTLYNNPSLGPTYAFTNGTLTLRSVGKLPGSAIVNLHGPLTNLAAKVSTTNYSYTVTSASGSLASLSGMQGNGIITLHTSSLGAKALKSSGTFKIQLA